MHQASISRNGHIGRNPRAIKIAIVKSPSHHHRQTGGQRSDRIGNEKSASQKLAFLQRGCCIDVGNSPSHKGSGSRLRDGVGRALSGSPIDSTWSCNAQTGEFHSDGLPTTRPSERHQAGQCFNSSSQTRRNSVGGKGFRDTNRIAAGASPESILLVWNAWLAWNIPSRRYCQAVIGPAELKPCASSPPHGLRIGSHSSWLESSSS